MKARFFQLLIKQVLSWTVLHRSDRGGAGDVRALARTTVSASLTAQNESTDTLLVGADTN